MRCGEAKEREGVFRGVASSHDYRRGSVSRGESSKHQRGPDSLAQPRGPPREIGPGFHLCIVCVCDVMLWTPRARVNITKNRKRASLSLSYMMRA